MRVALDALERKLHMRLRGPRNAVLRRHDTY
jgi:hypothetical protein